MQNNDFLHDGPAAKNMLNVSRFFLSSRLEMQKR